MKTCGALFIEPFIAPSYSIDDREPQNVERVFQRQAEQGIIVFQYITNGPFFFQPSGSRQSEIQVGGRTVMRRFNRSGAGSSLEFGGFVIGKARKGRFRSQKELYDFCGMVGKKRIGIGPFRFAPGGVLGRKPAIIVPADNKIEILYFETPGMGAKQKMVICDDFKMHVEGIVRKNVTTIKRRLMAGKLGMPFVVNFSGP